MLPLIINIKYIYQSMWRRWSCRCCCQNRPMCDPCGPYGRPGARGHHVGDPWFRFTMLL